MKFKKCVIDSPYLSGQESVFYRGKVLLIHIPPVYHPFHDDPCQPVAEVDGQFLYRINDCAIEEDCFVSDHNTMLIQVGHLWGLADERRNFN